jgi:hypothetical protein
LSEEPNGGMNATAPILKVSASISNRVQLDELIRQLQTLKAELSYYEEFEIKFFTTEDTER